MRRIAAVVALSASCLALAAPPGADATPENPAANAEKDAPVRAIAEWSLDAERNNLAIDGYDPVAYFPEGGGEPRKGKPEFGIVYAGVTYRFASAANRDTFKKNPSRYEPAHGGWCSWAMREGTKTEVDPKNFLVKDGRLFLFYRDFFTNTRTQWLKGDHEREAAEADAHWKEISGEDPRRG